MLKIHDVEVFGLRITTPFKPSKNAARWVERRRWIASFFFLSGFCGLTYQIIWLRLAFSQFGIITPVLSIVLSTFMLGLALGSWWAGDRSRPGAGATGLSAIYFYALNELLIPVPVPSSCKSISVRRALASARG